MLSLLRAGAAPNTQAYSEELKWSVPVCSAEVSALHAGNSRFVLYPHYFVVRSFMYSHQ